MKLPTPEIQQHIEDIISTRFHSSIDYAHVLRWLDNFTDEELVTEIKKFFPNKVYKTTIPRNVRLSEAPSYGEPIIYFDKNSKGAIAYMEFAEEFLSQQK